MPTFPFARVALVAVTFTAAFTCAAAGSLPKVATGAPGGATAGAGEAAVRAGAGGAPCFTIAEKEELRHGAPRFMAISVSDVGQRPAQVAWAMEMPPERGFPLMYSMCVPYAGRVSSLPQRPAAELAPGRPYEVTIRVRADASAAQPRHYVARFCLLRQADGKTALHLLPASGRAAAVCAAAK